LGSSNQQTSITTSFNFQQRPDYKRNIFNLAYGYTAHSGTRVTHTINPSEINFVNVNLGNDFASLLDKSNNLFLKNSFQSQLISSMRYGFQYNSQRIGEMKNFFFFQGNFESSGLLLRGSRELIKNPGINNDKYIVFGVPFSQFVRFDGDIRYFRFVGRSSSIAFRSFVGLGIPYGNSSVMPFVKSFFGGGANGIRAWIARSLGPGAYQNPTSVRFDQIGDIKLEWNFEYRAKIYKIFEGAAFIDAGNIWLRQKDIQRPLAEFESNRFYKEIAVGIGAGLRLNFDFFIIRLDLAYKMRDPSFPSNDRWVIQYQKLRQGNLNFGIGYPF
jgi:outer membrane protein assembly factor BamA